MGDVFELYCKMKKWETKKGNVLVEGTSDMDIFICAAKLYKKNKGIDLLKDLAVIPAGEGAEGGAKAVCDEMITIKRITGGSMRRTKSRVIGLLDKDFEADECIKFEKNHHGRLLEFRDVFRLHPCMPVKGNLDPNTLKKSFERLNANYKSLKWEVEDLLPKECFDLIEEQYADQINKKKCGDKVHYELGDKAKNAVHKIIYNDIFKGENFDGVIDVLKSLRFLLLL